MRKAFKIGICLLSLLLIAVCIGSLVAASAFSIAASDDFGHARTLGVFNVSLLPYLSACFEFAKKMYLQWQGTYFSMFLQALLSPLNCRGMPQLRAIMIINAILFFSSLITLALTALKDVKRENRYITLVIIAIVCFMFTGYEAYEEIFFWFSGAMSYSVPLSLLLFALIAFIRMNRHFRPVSFVLCSLFGFFAMGGSLTVSGTGCYLLLLLELYSYFKDKKLHASNIIVFVIWFAGALLNAAAPGNFVRHDVIDSTGIHPLKAIAQSCLMMNSRYQYFFSETNFAPLLICLFALGILLGKKNAITCQKSVFFIALPIIFTPIVTAFPVALGFSAQSIPNRCAFLIDFSIILSASILSVTTGLFLEEYCHFRREGLVLLTVITLVTCTLDGYSASKIKTLQIAGQLANGAYQKHYIECVDLMKKLEKYEPGETVLLAADEYPKEIDNIYNLFLSSDSGYWTNKAIANYYHLNSIAVANSDERLLQNE